MERHDAGKRGAGHRGDGDPSPGGLMVRYGQPKIGRSFFHTCYFMLERMLLGYYKKKSMDNMLVT
jgi:hypothetical protein